MGLLLGRKLSLRISISASSTCFLSTLNALIGAIANMIRNFNAFHDLGASMLAMASKIPAAPTVVPPGKSQLRYIVYLVASHIRNIGIMDSILTPCNTIAVKRFIFVAVFNDKNDHGRRCCVGMRQVGFGHRITLEGIHRKR
jgi:hypothetical protein